MPTSPSAMAMERRASVPVKLNAATVVAVVVAAVTTMVA